MRLRTLRACDSKKGRMSEGRGAESLSSTSKGEMENLRLAQS
jgi:hypothetical protein